MKVVDERDSTKFLPIVEIVDEIVPLFRKQHFVGIRRLVLLDEDYRRGRGAAGRYCPVKGSDQADIEMFFSHLAELPADVRDSRVYYLRTHFSSSQWRAELHGRESPRWWDNVPPHGGRLSAGG